MIVTFHTTSHGKVVYNGDVALQLIRLMNLEAKVPGIIPSEQVAAARRRLRDAVELEAPPGEEPESEVDDDDPPVGLKQRALPLLQLLDSAVSDEDHVTWDEGWSLTK